MELTQSAATCRWASPTIFQPAPLWLESTDAPWSCTRGRPARTLVSTDECRTCRRWQPQAVGTPGMADPREMPVRD